MQIALELPAMTYPPTGRYCTHPAQLAQALAELDYAHRLLCIALMLAVGCMLDRSQGSPDERSKSGSWAAGSAHKDTLAANLGPAAHPC